LNSNILMPKNCNGAVFSARRDIDTACDVLLEKIARISKTKRKRVTKRIARKRYNRAKREYEDDCANPLNIGTGRSRSAVLRLLKFMLYIGTYCHSKRPFLRTSHAGRV